MTQHGVDQPIVVDDVGEILKGHGRRLAAIEAGFKDFPVVQRFGLTEAEKKAMRIADNQVALLSGWDATLIRTDIQWLKASGYEMAMLGFGEAQLVSFETMPGPPSAFGAYAPETMQTEHQCPKCKYRWSGSSKPAEPAKKKNGKK